MEKNRRFTIGYSIIAFLLIVAVQFFLLAPPVDHIPYSEFKKLIREGKVKEIRIGSDRIVGSFRLDDKREQQFITLRVDDSELVSLLEQKQVRYDGVIKEHWLRDLVFYWVLPGAILYGIWLLIFNRLGSAGPALTFGRARARL
jgi:cell division protease FtsH